jgi:hypothetical protein
MGFNPTAHPGIAHLLRKHWRAHHLGAELGGGKANCEGEKGRCQSEPKRGITKREAEPDGGEHESYRYARIGLVGEDEIGDDAAGKKHGEPQEPAVRLGLERAGGCRKPSGQ